MKYSDILTQSIDVCCKKLWLYIIFTVFLSGSVFFQFKILSADEFNTNSLVLLLLLSFVFVLSTSILVMTCLKTPVRKFSFTFCLAFLLITVAFSFIFRYVLETLHIAKWITYLIGGVMLWALVSAIVISACYKYGIRDLPMGNTKNTKIKLYADALLRSLGISILIAFCALAHAHPGEIARTVLPPEKIAENERVVFWIAFFFFFPFYIVFLTEVYKAIEMPDEEEMGKGKRKNRKK